jgi:hypothetical protein
MWSEPEPGVSLKVGDTMTYEPELIDGFNYKRTLRCNFTHLSLAVEQFEALRRAGGFRQKQWCIPQDPATQVIPANDSYEIILDVGPGAVIWGYTFVGLTQEDEPGDTMSYQVRDACNDVSLFSEFATQQFSLWQGDPGFGGGQTLLSKLYVVGAPGLLTVEIANQQTTDQTAQLIIYGGVPDRG